MERKERLFTLLELLVVVAVIALLTAMLLPALGKAKQTAMGAICNSNLRQIGVGLVCYANDYGGFIPSARTNKTLMLNENGGYVSRSSILCPSVTHAISSADWCYNPILNERGVGAWCANHFSANGVGLLPAPPAGVPHEWSYPKLEACAQPSAVANLTDASVSYAWGSWATFTLIWGNSAHLDMEGTPTLGGIGVGAMNGAEGRAYRHVRTSPALFFDSHVEASAFPNRSCHQ